MAHKEQYDFYANLKRLYTPYFEKCSVLEVGSLNINGSIRTLFTDTNYVGLDVGQGPGVDQVCPGQLYSASTGSVHHVTSAECFEHNPFWRETFANMLRISSPEGMVSFTCATTGREVHGTSLSNPLDSPLTRAIGWEDYYRNLDADDFEQAFNLRGWFSAYHFLVSPVAADLYFYGFRRPLTNEDRQYFTHAAADLEAALRAASNTVRIGLWDGLSWTPRVRR